MHPHDPIPYAAIRLLGRLLARGWLDQNECQEPLAAAALAAANRASPHRDPAGLRCRTLQALHDSAAAATRARSRAAFTIRATLQPLLRAKNPATAIRHAAHATNQTAGHPLSRAEVELLAATAAAAALHHRPTWRA